MARGFGDGRAEAPDACYAIVPAHAPSSLRARADRTLAIEHPVLATVWFEQRRWNQSRCSRVTSRRALRGDGGDRSPARGEQAPRDERAAGDPLAFGVSPRAFAAREVQGAVADMLLHAHAKAR
jgi:hypothetical protein